MKMTKKKQHNKPTIETIINTVALAITAAGTSFLLAKDYWGFFLIMFGAGLEYFKYWGRSKDLW